MRLWHICAIIFGLENSPNPYYNVFNTPAKPLSRKADAQLAGFLFPPRPTADPPADPVKYTKKPLTFSEQIDLLASRGLIVGNRGEAEAFLGRVNYYRFSAYCIPFEKERHAFLPGTKFEQVHGLYELDRRLRLLIMEAIEPVEIATRTFMAYRLSHQYGPFAHSESKNFKPEFEHATWISDVLTETDRSKETFVSHFMATYDEYPQLPIWAAVEIMSFGSLSKLFSGLLGDDKREIAGKFGMHPRVLGSWLHTLVYVRNTCAHHARLWNRELAIAPRLPNKDPRWRALDPAHSKRLASVLFLLNSLTSKLPAGQPAVADWRSRVEAVLASDPGVPRFHECMGLPADWTKHPLWVSA